MKVSETTIKQDFRRSGLTIRKFLDSVPKRYKWKWITKCIVYVPHSEDKVIDSCQYEYDDRDGRCVIIMWSLREKRKLIIKEDRILKHCVMHDYSGISFAS